MNKIRFKIDLYILSLALLFFFLIIMTYNIPLCWGNNCQFIGFKSLIEQNIVSGIAAIFLIYSVYAYMKLEFVFKGSNDIPFRITKIESLNYEHLTFLATYIVPLVGFNLDSGRHLLVLGLLLIVMGFIYIRTDQFYANPSLALLGFHIYKADGDFKMGNREDIVLISKGSMASGQRVSYIQLDKRVYYVRRIKNGH